MDLIENIISNIATKHFGDYRVRNGEVVAELCPFCGGGENSDRGTFAINIKTGAYNCKRGGCEKKGTLQDLCSFLGEEDSVVNIPHTFIKKNKEYTKPNIELKPLTEEIVTYFYRRRISEETLKEFGVASDANGNIVFPFYRDGDLTFVKFRKPKKYTKEDGPKEWQMANTEPILFGMDKVSYNKPLVITEGECFPGEAEVLTPNGWVRLDEYNNEPVLAVDENFKGAFETPYAYVKKKYCGDMVTRSVNNTYYSQTTSNHNIVTTHETPNRHIKIVSKYKACEKLPTRDFIPRTSVVNGKGINLTNDQIALYLAVSADCTIDIRKTTRHCRFGVKKERKYLRMKNLLDNLGIEYFDNPKTSNGYYYIGFRTPDWIESKELPMSWAYDATYAQRMFILDEMVHWDGNNVKERSQIEYNSCNKNNAVLMQTLAHTCGYVASLKTRRNESEKHNTCYVVPIYLKKKYTSCQGINNDNHKWTTEYSGNVYCVSVSTGMILVRQHECITVTGNCDALSIYEAGYHNVVSVPSGCDNMAFLDTCKKWLDKFSNFIIFGDNDEPGRRMVCNLVEELGKDRCLIPQEYPAFMWNGKDYNRACKDANEILVLYGAETLLNCVNSCELAPIEGVLNLSDVAFVDPTTIPRIYSKIPSLDNLIGGFAEGSLTIVSGKRGNGKSTFSGPVALNAIQAGNSVCAYSGELSASQFLEWIMCQAVEEHYLTVSTDPNTGKHFPVVPYDIQQRIRKWLNNKFYLFDNTANHGKKETDAVLEVFKTCARRYGCKLFIVDNLMSILRSADDNENKAQANFTAELKAFAVKYKVAVITIAHPRKTKQGETFQNDDISGSSAISNLADTVLNIERDEVGLNIRVAKNRNFGTLGVVPCSFNKVNRRISERLFGDTMVYGWDHDGAEIPDVQAISYEEFQPAAPEGLMTCGSPF